MGISLTRYIRLDGGAVIAKCGAPSFYIGGATPDTPCLAVGDTYSSITKLAIGSHTTRGANAFL